MNARLRDYRMLWRAAVTHADARLSGIIRWGAAFVVIVLGATLAATNGPRAALVWFWCAVSAAILMDWVSRFMPGAVKLATPANAALVPQMRRRLVELSCLLCFVGLGGIVSAPYANANKLGAWLFWIVVLLIGSGLAAAGRAAGMAIVTTATVGWFLVDRIPAEWVALLSDPLVLVLSLPVYAVLIVLAVRAMFPAGGERHWAMLARRARWTAAAGKGDPLVEQVAGTKTRNWYAASLRRASAGRRFAGLALHALGPIHHPAHSLTALVFLCLFLLGLGVVVRWRVDAEAVAAIGWMFGCVLLFVPVAYAIRLSQLADGFSGEQGLLRLAPVSPTGAAAFNRQLGRALLRQTLLVWGLSAGAALLLSALGGAGVDALLRMASLSCLVLPVLAGPLRDHASRREHGAVATLTLLLIATVEGLLIGFPANAIFDLPVLPVAALFSIGFTIVVAWRRLRAMGHAPCAFPAGRMD